MYSGNIFGNTGTWTTTTGNVWNPAVLTNQTFGLNPHPAAVNHVGMGQNPNIWSFQGPALALPPQLRPRRPPLPSLMSLKQSEKPVSQNKTRCESTKPSTPKTKVPEKADKGKKVRKGKSTSSGNRTGALLNAIRSQIPQGRVSYSSKVAAGSYKCFETLLDPFLTMDAPYKLLPPLVTSVLTCVQEEMFARKLADLMWKKMIDRNTKPVHPCLKMRGLWLLGELLRPVYAPHMVAQFFLSEFKIEKLLDSFFKIGQIRLAYRSELHAIYNFWLEVVPEYAKLMSDMSCKHSEDWVTSSSPVEYKSCEGFYQRVESSARKIPGSVLGLVSQAMELLKKVEDNYLPASGTSTLTDKGKGDASGSTSSCSKKVTNTTASKVTPKPSPKTTTTTGIVKLTICSNKTTVTREVAPKPSPKTTTTTKIVIPSECSNKATVARKVAPIPSSDSTASKTVTPTSKIKNKNPSLLSSSEIKAQITLFRTGNKGHALESHYVLFERTFKEFLSVEDPSPSLKSLVECALVCAQDKQFAKKLADCIRSKTSFETTGPSCLKMRGLWLVGELLRDEYSSFVEELRLKLYIPMMLESFLTKCSLPKEYRSELRAIYRFWKMYAPLYIVEHMKTLCDTNHLSYVTKSEGNTTIYTCDTFYKIPATTWRWIPDEPFGDIDVPKTNAGQKIESKRIQNSSALSPCVYTNYNDLPKTARVTKTSGTSDKNNQIKATFSAQLDELISSPSGPGVPRAVGKILHSFLLYGNQEPISELIAQQLLDRPEENDSDPDKSVRILWVIGALYYPHHTERVKGTYGTLNAYNLTNIFRMFLKKISEDAREELREIFRFWNTVMPIVVTERLSDWISWSEDYGWLQSQANIAKKVGVTEFYKEEPVAGHSKSEKSEKRSEVVPGRDIAMVESPEFSDSEAEIVFEDERLKVSAGQSRLFKGVSQGGGTTTSAAGSSETRKRDSDLPCSSGASKRSKRNPTDDVSKYRSGYTASSSEHKEGTASNMSKLEMLRQKMSKDEALVSIGWGNYNYNRHIDRWFYLEIDFSVNDFATAICDPSVTNWDIVKDESGAYRVKVEQKLSLQK